VNSIIVWRICAATFGDRIFTGEGSLKVQGRWHPKGVPVIYTSDSRALSALEILVNAENSVSLHDRPWVIASAEIPVDLIRTPESVPEDWRKNPSPDSTRAFGHDWFSSRRSPAVRVPSAVVLGEFNYLLNPLHPDFARLTFSPPEPFHFDPRF
jgi:RES domain-containing protein